jgi:hypothetical protein
LNGKRWSSKKLAPRKTQKMSGGGILMDGRSLVSIPVIGSIIPLYETSEE